MKIDYKDRTNFNANMIAQSGNLKICKLSSQNDILFLKDFFERTDFKKLMPELPKNKTDRWHEMLAYAISNAGDNCNTTYITISDNKLCGIITCLQNKTTIIHCICTIPVEIGKKVKLAGKTLFYQIFKDFIEYDGTRIQLSAITNGPYNTINKYREFGFKETSDCTNTTVNMTANKYTIRDAFKKLMKIIDYKSLPNTKVNLQDIITN